METLLSHCAEAFADRGGLLLTFFLGGLTGGFAHCLAMCGPFVACESMCHSKSCGKTIRSGHAGSLSYHIGRLTTYGALGFAAALFSRQIAAFSWWPLLSSIMLASAGMLFLISCLNLHTHIHGHGKRSGLTYTRGLLMGFMPCGLLYAALMMAATLTNPLAGMVAMWVFTLGTMPALLLAGFGASALAGRWQNIMQPAGRMVMGINGIALLAMATHII